MPGPLAAARGEVIGTIVGDTKTANDPSVFRDAVPTNLIVQFNVLAYSKSAAMTLEIPAVGTVCQGTDLPNANLAIIAILAY